MDRTLKTQHFQSGVIKANLPPRKKWFLHLFRAQVKVKCPCSVPVTHSPQPTHHLVLFTLPLSYPSLSFPPVHPEWHNGNPSLYSHSYEWPATVSYRLPCLKQDPILTSTHSLPIQWFLRTNLKLLYFVRYFLGQTYYNGFHISKF